MFKLVGQTLPRWATRSTYSPVVNEADGETGHWTRHWPHRLRFGDSKFIWRALFAILALLLLANYFHPSRQAPIEHVPPMQITDSGWTTATATYRLPEANDTPIVSSAPETPHASNATKATNDNVDWTQYAYCQYVTNEDYLCNSMMIFESLVRLGAKADLLMMYPQYWEVGEANDVGRLLIKARDEYGVHLVPVEVQTLAVGEENTWQDSFTKLLAFNQTQYKRVLSLDSDGTILQPMDELFLLPPAAVAMPRAYWLSDADRQRNYLSSQVVLIQPSEYEFQRILHEFDIRGEADFDMEIVNKLYGESAMVLPHRPYDLLTGEFKSTDHYNYLGSHEVWNADNVVQEAKYIHFSDWPLLKPWAWTPWTINSGEVLINQPRCSAETERPEECRDRDIWRSFYSEYLERREQVCGAGFLVYKRATESVLQEPKSPPRWEPVFD